MKKALITAGLATIAAIIAPDVFAGQASPIQGGLDTMNAWMVGSILSLGGIGGTGMCVAGIMRQGNMPLLAAGGTTLGLTMAGAVAPEAMAQAVQSVAGAGMLLSGLI